MTQTDLKNYTNVIKKCFRVGGSFYVKFYWQNILFLLINLPIFKLTENSSLILNFSMTMWIFREKRNLLT